MEKTARDIALLIDWRLGRMCQLNVEMEIYERKAKKCSKNNENDAQKKSESDFYQERLDLCKKNISTLKKEMAQMDPSAEIRKKMINVYLDQLDKTHDRIYLKKIKAMDLSPSMLVRSLLQRLSDQYANQSFCLMCMDTLISKKTQSLSNIPRKDIRKGNGNQR